MKKFISVLLVGAVSCVAPISHAQNTDWMRGGPVSDALVQALEAQDEAALVEVWPGKIYELTGNYKSTVNEIDRSRVFKAVSGCDLTFKLDDEQNSRAVMSWDCPSRIVPGDECFFESVNVALRVLQFAGEAEALYLVSGKTYDNDCGPIRPAFPQSLPSGTE